MAAAVAARVRRTFIEYPVQPEFMDLGSLEDEDDDDDSQALRTQSDPIGANADYAQPRKVLVPMRGLQEETRSEVASNAAGCGPFGEAAIGDEEEEDEEDDDDDGAELGCLGRTTSVVRAGEEQSALGAGWESPDSIRVQPAIIEEDEAEEAEITLTTYESYDPSGCGGSTLRSDAAAWEGSWTGVDTSTGAEGMMSWAGAYGDGVQQQLVMPRGLDTCRQPPFGELHTFHRETLQFCGADPDLRVFAKGNHFHGRLSVVTESKVRNGGVHRYMVQLAGGNLSRADGIGFVFSRRLPCTKDIQKIASIYLNQHGEVGLRLFSKLDKAKEHVAPLEIGDWIEMSVDLDNNRADFGVWRWRTDGWPPVLHLASAAGIDFGGILPDLEHTKGRAIGYMACVVKNSGTSMRLGS